jgi:carboxypeptidase C (cathepsin A)
MKTIMNFLSVITMFSVAVSVNLRGTQYTNEALNDEIIDLPGLNEEIEFNQFSGYLNLDGTQKQIHYWLVESEQDPTIDPLVFWTNGGPGCSGLIGFMTEQGPFRPNDDGSLLLNEWRWNKISNMVFLEQPVGVGFSYSDNEDDYRIGDSQAAKDNLETILQFLKRFPQYSNSPLYITSESYGGHYMPTLAVEIDKYNEANGNPLNFKGFAVGNPYTDYYSGVGAEMETYWGKQLLPKPSWDKYVATGCLDAKTQLNNSICSTYILDFMKKIGNLNPYALDYPVCVTPQQVWTTNMIFDMIKENNKYILNDNKFNTVIDAFLSVFKSVGLKDEYEPCEANFAIDYLNDPQVKEAIHVKSNIVWEECSRTVKYEYLDKMLPMEDYYNQLLNSANDKNLRILVYSGDDDSVCGTIGTQKWIWDLGYKVKTGEFWKVWDIDGQTAGYITQFDTPFSRNPRLTFATVHFAGHEVPTYKPKEAFYLFKAYLDNDYSFENL